MGRGYSTDGSISKHVAEEPSGSGRNVLCVAINGSIAWSRGA